MEVITDKIKLFKDLEDRQKEHIYKVLPLLIAIPFEDLNKNVTLLSSYGINITGIDQIKICALEPEKLKERLEHIKDGLNIEDFIASPLELLNQNPYNPVIEEKVEEHPEITINEEKEVDHSIDLNAFLDQYEASAPKEQIDEIPHNIETDEDTTITDEIEDYINNSTVNLTMENFDRYQILSESINHIIESINTKSLQKEPSIYEILSLLVGNNVPSDYKCLYISLTYNKDFPEDILLKIKNAINEELSILNKMRTEGGPSL